MTGYWDTILYRIRQNIRGGKLSRFISNVHYVGKFSRFAALKPTRASVIRILECAQVRITFDTRADRMAEAEFETDSSVRGYHVYQDNWTPVIGERLHCER